MAAANTDKLRKKKSLFQTTLNGGISDSDTSLTLQSASGLPTDTGVTITINRVDANGVATPSAMEVIVGVVSGSTVGSLLRAQDSTTAKSHATASVVEMTWDAETWNDAVDHLLTEHNQDGTHKPAAISATIVTAAAKTTPVDTDSFGIVDSEASNVLKELTFTKLKVFLKTWLTSEAFSFVTGVKDFAAGILTATSPVLTTPKIVTSINDANGNEVIKTPATASAVNEITVTNAATAGTPTISATGGDTNIHLDLQGKANGLVKISVLRKNDTTNVYSHQSVILTGWGYKVGDATNKLGQTTETFGITFNTAPVVIIGLLGAITGGTVPTSIGQAVDTGSLSDSNGIWIGAAGISTTGFTANIRIGAAGSTWASTVRIMYSWIAIGTL